MATVAMLGACATTPPGSHAVDQEFRRYTLDGRFSVRQGERSGAGRISWTHAPGIDTVLIQDPFGNGLAELEHRPGMTTIRMADGSVASDPDPEALMLRLTGLPLPVAGIGDWLSGRVGKGAAGIWAAEFDSLGRTQKLERDGWRVRFEYAENLADALPSRIFATRADALELRLSADQWTPAP